MKAILPKDHADRLSEASSGTLIAYTCPHGKGWHVQNRNYVGYIGDDDTEWDND